MPRLPVDYSKSVIYILQCNDIEIKEEYIGSTTDFRKRKSTHKYACNNENNKSYNQSKYVFIREHGGWENWKMIQLEEFPCENKRELEKTEEEIRRERKAKLNSYASYIENPYQRELELNPNRNKEQYQRSLELHPNHNKEHYQHRLKLNPNFVKEQYERQREKLLSKYTCELCGKELCISSRSRHNKRKHS